MRRELCKKLLSLLVALLPSGALAQSCNTPDRSVLLILDSSGSMNARLPNGETRIAVAKRAIKGVAGFVPARAQISLRMYGAQSPAKQKNCQDTHVAVPFGPAESGNAAIAAAADEVKAQGYTPIAHSLEQAANDFPPAAKERVIVLVSDGKETCRGDPVVAAKALTGKRITVHTVGFVVDTAARGQLQNIARITGGTYFDASVGPELPETLKKAFEACKQRVVTLPPNPKPGKLRTTAGGMNNNVFNAETGQRVDNLLKVRHEITLPAGIYEVQFGPARWKGIEIRPGETTTISPAVLQLANRVGGAQVVDSETGERHGAMDAASGKVVVIPGLYDLKFRLNHSWRFVRLEGGKVTKLSLARVVLHPELKWKKARITTTEGQEVWHFDAVTHSGSVPPGEYIVIVDDKVEGGARQWWMARKSLALTI